MIEGTPVLHDRELAAIVQLVYQKSGITLHEGKRALISARLQKRLREGGFKSFKAYLATVEQDESGQELVSLLDAIATNHTSFFREPQHFTCLVERLLPRLANASRPRDIRIWSAACSSGEEPFSIVMTLMDALPLQAMARVRVLASDISTKALARATSGLYPMERVQSVPLATLKRYFKRGLGALEGLAQVAPGVRSAVEFRRLNLLEIDHLGETFDVIFCRNVMIYFDKAVQQRVVTMLERHLRPGGTLFISHSESLNGIRHGLRWVAPATYERVAS